MVENNFIYFILYRVDSFPEDGEMSSFRSGTRYLMVLPSSFLREDKEGESFT